MSWGLNRKVNRSLNQFFWALSWDLFRVGPLSCLLVCEEMEAPLALTLPGRSVVGGRGWARRCGVYTEIYSWRYISSMGFDKCLQLCIQHHIIIQRRYPCIPVSTPPPLSTSSHWSVLCPCSLAFSRMSYKWYHIICGLLHLASFTA